MYVFVLDYQEVYFGLLKNFVEGFTKKFLEILLRYYKGCTNFVSFGVNSFDFRRFCKGFFIIVFYLFANFIYFIYFLFPSHLFKYN